MPKEAVFVVTLSPAPTEPVTVNYATRADTAVAGTDFTARSGALAFAAGETSKEVTVPVVVPVGGADKRFYLDVTWPAGYNGTVQRGAGTCVLVAGPAVQGRYYEAFITTRDILMDPVRFWGPPSGPQARTVPYHAMEKLMVEAPDSGHQSVSETVSFLAKLGAWDAILTGSTDTLARAWTVAETYFIPTNTEQNWAGYTTTKTADYQPEAETPAGYPVLPAASFPAGAGTGGSDPLAAEFLATYGSHRLELMHWFLDVDGDYGFRNVDGTTVNVKINSYQRGMQESTWECVTHPELEDFNQQGPGGHPSGFLNIFAQSKPDYPAAQFEASKQFRFTCAPDAEARMLGATFLAAESGVSVTPLVTKARKMGDHLRYALYDKYFHKGAGIDGTGFAGLISWYVSGGRDATGPTPTWGFRISSSNYHQGYQSPDIAWYMAAGGGGFTPLSPNAGSQWLTSLNKQLELLRWLQTPEGALAGGVTNSWMGRYETPTDGREAARFNGMYFTYAPEWHDPPSNKWFGFQVWCLQRVAEMYLVLAGKDSTLATETRTKCAVILDRWVNWLLDNSTVGGGTFTLPIDLEWTSPTQIVGKTTTAPNNEGVFEYLPTLDWNSATGDHAAFWNASGVPNPNLKCTITASGQDLGSASCAAQLLIQYAQAKRAAGGSLADTIPGGAHTVQQALDAGKGIVDVILDSFADEHGFAKDEERRDYNRFFGEVYIPPSYTGRMPNGDVIQNGATFIGIRSFMQTWDGWDQVAAYGADGSGPVPVFRYHRFWHLTEIAAAAAMLHHYFADVVYSGS